jgi:hypothetical protein
MSANKRAVKTMILQNTNDIRILLETKRRICTPSLVYMQYGMILMSSGSQWTLLITLVASW